MKELKIRENRHGLLKAVSEALLTLFIVLAGFAWPVKTSAATFDKTFDVKLSDFTFSNEHSSFYPGYETYAHVYNDSYELNVGDRINITLNLTNDLDEPVHWGELISGAYDENGNREDTLEDDIYWNNDYGLDYFPGDVYDDEDMSAEDFFNTRVFKAGETKTFKAHITMNKAAQIGWGVGLESVGNYRPDEPYDDDNNHFGDKRFYYELRVKRIGEPPAEVTEEGTGEGSENKDNAGQPSSGVTVNKTFSVKLSDFKFVDEFIYEEDPSIHTITYGLDDSFEANIGDTVNLTINILNDLDGAVNMTSTFATYYDENGNLADNDPSKEPYRSLVDALESNIKKSENPFELLGLMKTYEKGETHTFNLQFRMNRAGSFGYELMHQAAGDLRMDDPNAGPDAKMGPEQYNYFIKIKWTNGVSYNNDKADSGEQKDNYGEDRSKADENHKDENTHKESSGSKKKKSHSSSSSSSSSSASNPDALAASVLSGSFGSNVAAAKQVQGPIAQALFAAIRPAGWSEAFSFNIITDGKADYSVKNGKLAIQIPDSYQKAGRQFAILALDQSGAVFAFPDTDASDLTITVNINTTAYAFDLIYTS